MKTEMTEQTVLTVDDQRLDIESIRANFPMLQTEVNGKRIIYFIQLQRTINQRLSAHPLFKHLGVDALLRVSLC
jgi:hypothetical protein